MVNKGKDTEKDEKECKWCGWWKKTDSWMIVVQHFKFQLSFGEYRDVRTTTSFRLSAVKNPSTRSTFRQGMRISK